MSATSSSDIRSLRPTSRRSCGSVSGSGVAARSRAHSARENSRNLETTSPSPWRVTGGLYVRIARTTSLKHQRDRRPEADRDHQPAHVLPADAAGDPGAADAADD